MIWAIEDIFDFFNCVCEPRCDIDNLRWLLDVMYFFSNDEVYRRLAACWSKGLQKLRALSFEAVVPLCFDIYLSEASYSALPALLVEYDVCRRYVLPPARASS